MTPAPDVLPVDGWGYIVKTASLSGAMRTSWHLVRGDSCDCEAGTAGQPRCRHRRAVAEFCADEDRKHARPAGRVDPSMFVD